MAPGEEEEKDEEEKEEVEKEKEEEELLLVNRAQEEAQTQVYQFSPTSSSSQTPLAPKHRHEDFEDQTSSDVEVGSSIEPSLSPSSVTSTTVTLGGQDFASQEAGDTVPPAAGHEIEFEAPQQASEKSTMGIAVLAGKQGKVLSSASFPQASSGFETPDEDPLYPGASAAFSQAPQDMELTPSSATLGQEDLSQQSQQRQAAEAQSRIPWDSTQVMWKCMQALATLGLHGSGRSARLRIEAQNCWGCTPHGLAVGVLTTLTCEVEALKAYGALAWFSFFQVLLLLPLASTLLMTVERVCA